MVNSFVADWSGLESFPSLPFEHPKSKKKISNKKEDDLFMIYMNPTNLKKVKA